MTKLVEKRVHNWYQLQQDIQGWNEIKPDQDVVDRLAGKHWNINLSKCHDNLKQKLLPHIVKKSELDFFVITDLEFSKMPLNVLFKYYKDCYKKSKFGIYISVLSYYINSPTKYKHLTDTYSKNIDLIFRENLNFVNRIENVSDVNDWPINIVKDNSLIEGSNFIFVHPNVRYFLWK